MVSPGVVTRYDLRGCLYIHSSALSVHTFKHLGQQEFIPFFSSASQGASRSFGGWGER